MHTTLAHDRLYVTVDLMVLTQKDGALKLLLSQRDHEPEQGKWALPGRFVACEHSAEETVDELMAEMLPLKAFYAEQLYTFTHPMRDPRGRILSIAYLVIAPWQQLEPVLQSEGIQMKCFDIATQDASYALTGEDGTVLQPEELAFDHAQIIRTGVSRLQGKIDYTSIGFRFLNDPDAFSLSELQQIFEAVLGKAQDNSNFRRFVRNRYEENGAIIPTDKPQKKSKGRPAVLYQWRESK